MYATKPSRSLTRYRASYPRDRDLWPNTHSKHGFYTSRMHWKKNRHGVETHLSLKTRGDLYSAPAHRSSNPYHLVSSQHLSPTYPQ